MTNHDRGRLQQPFGGFRREFLYLVMHLVVLETDLDLHPPCSKFVALVALAAALDASAAGHGCEPLRVATSKFATVPFHSVSYFQRGNTRLSWTESLVIGNQKWTRDDAASPWEKEPAQRDVALRELENAECRYLRDDSSDDEAVAVYDVRQPDGAASGKKSTQLWISKVSGLPVRAVAGDAAGGAIIKYDYRNIDAPGR